MQHEEQLTMKR